MAQISQIAFADGADMGEPIGHAAHPAFSGTGRYRKG
jgi:hypothetical protein